MNSDGCRRHAFVQLYSSNTGQFSLQHRVGQTFSPSSTCKEPAASATGTSPYAKGGGRCPSDPKARQSIYDKISTCQRNFVTFEQLPNEVVQLHVLGQVNVALQDSRTILKNSSLGPPVVQIRSTLNELATSVSQKFRTELRPVRKLPTESNIPIATNDKNSVFRNGELQSGQVRPAFAL